MRVSKVDGPLKRGLDLFLKVWLFIKQTSKGPDVERGYRFYGCGWPIATATRGDPECPWL